LLLLAASPEDIEVLLISATYGNVPVQSCLTNVVTIFHTIAKEMAWRESQGLPSGFEQLKQSKPLVSVGPEEPLGEQQMMADYFHGVDGLGGISSTHAHLSPPETWKSLFPLTAGDAPSGEISPESLFTPSTQPSHLEILRLLEENPPNTIDVIAVGPLTTVAVAAAHSPQTLMRAKSIIVMGGSIDVPGNITPLAEFNTYADSIAAARVYALTSPNPITTMPPAISVGPKYSGPDHPLLKPYPLASELGDKRLNVILFPLDITTKIPLRRRLFESKMEPLVAKGSPLAEWLNAIMTSMFNKMTKLAPGKAAADDPWLDMHDPACVWYALTGGRGVGGEWAISEGEDLRVETTGQWARGAYIKDRRDRTKGHGGVDEDVEKEVIGDAGGWLSDKRGNRLRVCTGTPGNEALAPLLLKTVFGV
jgi:inosine-uridine nucleoside N-ribohydrolase